MFSKCIVSPAITQTEKHPGGHHPPSQAGLSRCFLLAIGFIYLQNPCNK
ncbi:hypothetical protein CCHR01_07692 [Colletotrichum chrysophilum]|uniref:Uncharacterized protein n=1 Tax=Colletotrichum chrysophilum TaxID=1836956 RepID=A0AAD9AJT1_9PEZI|nr:hypothetical protein CCHR01_07692 [Colletotrichum chrysophilum]